MAASEAWSCTAGTLTGSSLVLAAGATASCSITNTFEVTVTPVGLIAEAVINALPAILPTMDVADRVEDRHRLAVERFIIDLTDADPRIKEANHALDQLATEVDARVGARGHHLGNQSKLAAAGERGGGTAAPTTRGGFLRVIVGGRPDTDHEIQPAFFPR